MRFIIGSLLLAGMFLAASPVQAQAVFFGGGGIGQPRNYYFGGSSSPFNYYNRGVGGFAGSGFTGSRYFLYSGGGNYYSGFGYGSGAAFGGGTYNVGPLSNYYNTNTYGYRYRGALSPDGRPVYYYDGRGEVGANYGYGYGGGGYGYGYSSTASGRPALVPHCGYSVLHVAAPAYGPVHAGHNVPNIPVDNLPPPPRMRQAANPNTYVPSARGRLAPVYLNLGNQTGTVVGATQNTGGQALVPNIPAPRQ